MALSRESTEYKELKDLNEQMLSLSILIKNALLDAALANEDPITYEGTSFDITLQKITSKYLASKVVQNN